MDFSNIPLFNVMKAKLGYLSERQSVLAQNVANADTPGYKAMDVAAPDFAKMAMAQGGGNGAAQVLPMVSTDPGHMAPMPPMASFKTEMRKSSYELNPDGNNVVIEEEMAKIAENQGSYQEVLNLYSTWVTLFKTAIDSSSTGS